MQIRELTPLDRVETLNLFRTVFTKSEGVEEGKMLESLVGKVFDSLAAPATLGFGGYLGERLVAAIFFSQLDFPDGERVYLLSPVAVATAEQRSGLGSALIKVGLSELRSRDVVVVMTYGDPAYYGRFGFEMVSVETVAAPYPLSMPIGWLGLSLGQDKLLGLSGTPQTQPAFADPAIW